MTQIPVQGVDKQTFLSVLQFLYTGNVKASKSSVSRAPKQDAR